LFCNQTNVHAEINRHAASLPEPVIDFCEARHTHSFQEKLLQLEDGLSTYVSHLPATNYFKYLFQGFCQYYLQKKTYVTYLNQAANTGLFPQFLPLIIQLIYEQRRAERILIMVSFDDERNGDFKKLSGIHDTITVIAVDDDFDPDDLFTSWGVYDQVFIAGHGENRSETYDGHIRLGKKILTPGMITQAVNENTMHPPILGVFTCGEAFCAMEIKSQFDYFISDHLSSVSRFVEMFLYGYLVDYFRSYTILHAFEAGRLATIFQAKSDPTYKIFTRGVKLQQ